MPLFAIARPLYTAPSFAVNTMMAFAASTAPDQPAMLPPSPSKMKVAAALVVPLPTTKPVLALATMPVGLNGTPPVAAKCATTGVMTPLPLYSVDVSLWLFATHMGDVAPSASPHGFFSCGSVTGAVLPAWSSTRLVAVYALAAFTVRLAV